MVGHLVNNRSTEIILCSVTNRTQPSGSPGFFKIRPGQSESWDRKGFEEFHFKSEDGSKNKHLIINRGSPAMVNFDGFDKDLSIFNDYKPDLKYLVKNRSNRPIWNSIGGPYYKIEPGADEPWTHKSGWNTVVFRDENDTDRAGVYVNCDGPLPTIEFFGLDKEILVHRSTQSFIAREHWDQAIMLADNTQNAQDSRASRPGGILPSIYKVDTLEKMTGGNQTSIGDHSQIYNLAMLMVHTKYALADPAICVAVDPQWVKVAAYTAEFDAIVVLGFPTTAIDLIAPKKQRPVVGQRLIAISNFPSRDADHQGTVGDITQGPNTHNRYYNFQPLVAQFLSDDSQEDIWEKHMSEVEESKWGTTWELWLTWKQKRGVNCFRSGTPSRVMQIAKTHGFHDAPPPSYSPF